MKTITISTVFLLLAVALSAQTTITYTNNGLISGDSYNFQEIQFPDPGSDGPNQIWDFSKVQLTGKTPVGNLQSPSLPKLDGIADYNISLLENGYDYFLNSTDADLQELGYVNNDLKLTLRYSDPVVKMKYPFAYGARFSDHFISVGIYNENSTIDFFGDNVVSADAYGTLMLPDRIIENALRVKTVKTGLQINMCGIVDVNIVKYTWYAPGYRYPVLILTTAESRPSIGAVQVTKSAFTNTQQPNKSISVAGLNGSLISTDPAKSGKITDVAVSVSPNPFNEKLTYQYFLNESRNVSIELYTITGKNISWIVKDQLQQVGLQTGELNSLVHDLAQGVYFIRFTFDKQVVIHKVVKI